ncbi:helix-turn-helix domain-containing protein [Rhodococcus sp. NPDC057297]|uniref:helix-turn-helix domain-containing protein n=1 Tax=Rhodococcus sp. NPDC057297 TaxID=3346090 RepID=UPI00363A8C19
MINILDIDTPEYVTLAQAVEITGRKQPTITSWISSGKLQNIHRLGRRVLIELGELRDVERATRHRSMCSEPAI